MNKQLPHNQLIFSIVLSMAIVLTGYGDPAQAQSGIQLQDLSNELLSHTAGYLPPKELLLNFSLTNRRFHDISIRQIQLKSKEYIRQAREMNNSAAFWEWLNSVKELPPNLQARLFRALEMRITISEHFPEALGATPSLVLDSEMRSAFGMASYQILDIDTCILGGVDSGQRIKNEEEEEDWNKQLKSLFDAVKQKPQESRKEKLLILARLIRPLSSEWYAYWFEKLLDELPTFSRTSRAELIDKLVSRAAGRMVDAYPLMLRAILKLQREDRYISLRDLINSMFINEYDAESLISGQEIFISLNFSEFSIEEKKNFFKKLANEWYETRFVRFPQFAFLMDMALSFCDETSLSIEEKDLLLRYTLFSLSSLRPTEDEGDEDYVKGEREKSFDYAIEMMGRLPQQLQSRLQEYISAIENNCDKNEGMFARRFLDECVESNSPF